jgi:hypothetical protein
MAAGLPRMWPSLQQADELCCAVARAFEVFNDELVQDEPARPSSAPPLEGDAAREAQEPSASFEASAPTSELVPTTDEPANGELEPSAPANETLSTTA